MRIKTIERLMFGLFGRTAPVTRVSDIDADGKIHTIHFLGEVKERDNSLVCTWDSTGWEKDPEEGMINIIDPQGIRNVGYIVSPAGKTISIYAEPRKYPNYEKIIGDAATVDDIAENFDLEKSQRKLYMGIAVGMPIGYVVISLLLQIISKIAS
jgi:hypothetical protein